MPITYNGVCVWLAVCHALKLFQMHIISITYYAPFNVKEIVNSKHGNLVLANLYDLTA